MIMKKVPFVTNEQLKSILEKYPTPFHLYDEKGIRENAKAMHFPGTKVSASILL